MGALAWLVIPVIAVLVAAVWAAWAARPPKATADGASLADYERFRAALERSTTPAGPAERR
ncbi:hypothetical protein [Peterkaempfera bronchialis]|uniref:Uncharacterized protein n=1 Tax=Peterkaempfera bronchialis TaxID=2126346 RepID=A0A345T055_9ACTN|nr:hypothetical protein [Peterkaempfera bronchialis]AXI79360.1 hypothetical protein C7M71_020015 [Peterkaempfera bronchialis]